MAAKRGVISFGLVSIPVELHVAARPRVLDFDMLHATCQTRIKYQLYCPTHQRAVSRRDIVKGYRRDGGYVVMEDEDFERAERATSRAIEVVAFVGQDAVDPIYLERSYFVAPGPDGARPYAILLEAMRRAGKAAVVTFVMSNRQQYAVLRPQAGELVLHTLYYGDEVREVPVDRKRPRSSGKREVQFAEQYIAALTQEFDPTRYRDEYRKTLQAIIRAKSDGTQVRLPEARKPAGKVVNLMDALRQSVVRARKPGTRARTRAALRRSAERRPRARKAA